MKECVNCSRSCLKSDKYCRKCGIMLKSGMYYVIINIINFIISVLFIAVIALLILSYKV